MLETQLIPIEFDETHEKEARLLKDYLNNNSLLFQVFVAGYKKISFYESTDEDVLSITSIQDLKDRMTESAPKYMELLHNQVFSESKDLMEVLFLKMLILDKLDAYENYNPELAASKEKNAHINSVYSILAATYYEEIGTPEKLIDFIFEPTEEEKKKVFDWLNNKKRYELLNHLLSEQYQVLIQTEDEEEVHDPFLEQNISEVLKISEVDFLGGNIIIPGEEKQIEIPKLSKEELDRLCIEFFIEIDPSLKWLKIYNKLKETKKIIYKNPLPEENLGWGCLMTKDDIEIYAPLEGTIRDFRYFIHEFAHYISISVITAEESLPPAIKEFPSIFFEMYASIFLKEKNYSIEAINYLSKERNEWTQSNMIDVTPTLRYLSQVLTEGPITFEKEKSKMENLRKNISEDLPEALKNILNQLLATDEDNVNRPIDNEIAFLLQYPYCVVQEYPYIMGKYFATKTLEKVIENPQMIYTVFEITENLPKETVEGVIQKLGLSTDEFTSPKEQPPQYVKTPQTK